MQQLSVSSAQKQVLETSSLSYFLPSYLEYSEYFSEDVLFHY